MSDQKFHQMQFKLISNEKKIDIESFSNKIETIFFCSVSLREIRNFNMKSLFLYIIRDFQLKIVCGNEPKMNFAYQKGFIR